MVRTRWIERGRRFRRDGGQSSSFRSSCVSTSCGVFCIERRNIHACMCVCVWWFIGAVEQVETRESPLTCPSFLPLLSHSMFHLIFIFLFLLHMQGNPKHPPPATTSLLSSCIAPALLFSRVFKLWRGERNRGNLFLGVKLLSQGGEPGEPPR